MSNPLFNALGGGMPQGNGPMQMIQQFMQFKQNFRETRKQKLRKCYSLDGFPSSNLIKFSRWQDSFKIC